MESTSPTTPCSNLTLNPPTCSLSSLSISSSSPPDTTTTTKEEEQAELVYRSYRGEQDLKHIVSLVDDELSEPYNLYTYRYFLDTWPHLCFFAFSSKTSSEDQEEVPLGVIISKLEPHSKTSCQNSLISITSPQEEHAWVTTGGVGGGGGEILIDEVTGEKKRCRMRGYLAMLSVRKDSRGKGIATHLLRLSLTTMLKPPPPSPPLPLTSFEWFFFPPDEIVLETESDNFEALSFYKKMGFVREKELFRFYLNGKRAARLKLDLRKIIGGIVG
ncbi:hypothetical protein JCM3765_007316 [Sporobolomyces pararoseus]